jgi:hypothetical protein
LQCYGAVRIAVLRGCEEGASLGSAVTGCSRDVLVFDSYGLRVEHGIPKWHYHMQENLQKMLLGFFSHNPNLAAAADKRIALFANNLNEAFVSGRNCTP